MGFGVLEQASQPVTMSDGTQLQADVYRPTDLRTGRAAAGPFPVIVTITPYRKVLAQPVAPLSGYSPYFVQRGYIYVVVDVRGTGASGGVFCFFCEREQQDGPEVVRWAARLPASNGNVGMYGGSYLGITQLFTAERIGPGSPLKAIMPVVAANDAYRDFGAPGGMLALPFAAGWGVGVRPAADFTPSEGLGADPIGGVKATIGHVGELGEFQIPQSIDILTGDLNQDSPYWRLRSPSEHIAKIVDNKVPAMLIGGWGDVFQRGEPRNYAALQNALAGRPVDGPMAPGQPASGRYQLVMGPWFHATAVGGKTLPDIALQWFDRWLKGRHNGIDDTTTPFHAFEHGSHRWVDTTSYPFAGATVHTLYLDGGHSGTAGSLNDGALSDRRPTATVGADGIDWAPVANLCSKQAEQWVAGPSTAASLFNGSDTSPNTCLSDDRPMQTGALTYTTAPFTKATSLAGPVDATLYLTSSRPEAQIVATLEDIAPDGRSFPLTAGYLTGSNRLLDTARSWTLNSKLVAPYHPFTKAAATPLTPGKIERLDVEIFPTLAQLAPGHRLRVTITTSATPYLTPTLQQGAQLLGGHYNIQRTASHPSHLNLPLIPSQQLTTSPRVWGTCDGSC